MNDELEETTDRFKRSQITTSCFKEKIGSL